MKFCRHKLCSLKRNLFYTNVQRDKITIDKMDNVTSSLYLFGVIKNIFDSRGCNFVDKRYLRG